jgi:hypothetical protein
MIAILATRQPSTSVEVEAEFGGLIRVQGVATGVVQRMAVDDEDWDRQVPPLPFNRDLQRRLHPSGERK